jgi:NadR type nicotinamide-nucleotide adenylyltransferase
MYKRTAVIGKFYPFHLGHKHLIDVAQAQSEALYIMVCWNKNESIPAGTRYNWLRSAYPNANVLLVEDKDYDQNDSKLWAKLTVKWLGFVPDAVFTSESYGDTWAKYLGCEHVLVDRDRATVPISGTKIRKDPFKYWEYMLPIVRSYFVKKVCLVGAESTGKSTLSLALAKQFKTTWAPEYGRAHWESRLPKEDLFQWSEDDFVKIAEEQNRLEDELVLEANKVLICDTNAFATAIWFERYMNYSSARVDILAKERHYDLYIVPDINTPFEDDGTRDGEHLRGWMNGRFIEELKKTGVPYIVASGSAAERLQQSAKAIDALLK